MGDVINFKERVKKIAEKESIELTEALSEDLDMLWSVILVAQNAGLSNEEIYKVCKEGQELAVEYENNATEIKELIDNLLKQMLFGNAL